MPNQQSQEFLFRRIKELLPPHIPLVDAVADILHISADSAYRRIRGETPVVLDEARCLCRHFKLSLDQILDVQSGSILFQDVRINKHSYPYEKYLAELILQLEHSNGFVQKEIIYVSKDLPLFHNFYFTPLSAFRYFFWMKTIYEHPDFKDREFSTACLPPGIEKLCLQLLKAYQFIPSTEIWNAESINSMISQVEFYKDSGLFASAADIKDVYSSMEETVSHVRDQTEAGCKFMPGESSRVKKHNFNLLYNRVVLGDNSILIVTDGQMNLYINYGGLNYLNTRDESYCKLYYNDMLNIRKRSTLLSMTGEKQRNIFFETLLSKIRSRTKNI